MAPTPESDSVRPGSPELASKFKQILKSNGIHDAVSQVIFKDSGLRGENMASETEYVTITFENPSKKPLNLFVKKLGSNPIHAGMIEESRLFNKETTFFCKYLPDARQYCQLMGQEDLMNIYPKCYYGDEKMLAFENLVVDKGYFLLKKEDRQDYDAAILALTTLAKHHAIAHALIQELGGPEKFFTRYPDLKFEAFSGESARTFLEPAFENGINTNLQILKKSVMERSGEVHDKFHAMKGKPFNLLMKALETSPTEFLALNHGDYWNNNMMFLKEGDNNNISGHIAVDFQVSRYNSPTLDIGYFLFSSVKSKVRKTHLQEFLKNYLDVLKATTSDLGHHIKLTLEDLQADYCKHFKFGFMFGSFLMSEAGYSVIKDLDMTQLKDADDWAAKLNDLVLQWLDDHPEKCEANAKDIISLMDEYQRLEKGVMI